MLISRYEPCVIGLIDKIISFGSFEKDGSYPYVYNNSQNTIVLQDLDDQLLGVTNNIIDNYKTLSYKDNKSYIPILNQQIKYEVLDQISKNNNCRITLLTVVEFYKQILPNVDSNGILMLGFRYDTEKDSSGNITKYKTIGIRGKFGLNNNIYGISLWAEALQYDVSDINNITITSLNKSNVVFYEYDYKVNNYTINMNFNYDSTNNELDCYIGSVEKDINGNKYIDNTFTINCDDNNASFDPSKIEECITTGDRNKQTSFSYFHIKTFNDVLTDSEAENQSKILVTVEGVKYV